MFQASVFQDEFLLAIVALDSPKRRVDSESKSPVISALSASNTKRSIERNSLFPIHEAEIFS